MNYRRGKPFTIPDHNAMNDQIEENAGSWLLEKWYIARRSAYRSPKTRVIFSYLFELFSLLLMNKCSFEHITTKDLGLN